MNEVLNHLATDVDGPLSGHPGSEARQLQRMPPVLESDAEAWAIRINSRWRQSRENIIETGQLLIDAKKALPHGRFEKECEIRLDFGSSVAQRLMAIARDKRLSNPAHVQLLPPHYSTLYEISRLTDDQMARGFREHIIRPDMERADVDLLRPEKAAPRIAQPMSTEEILGSDGRTDEAMARDVGAGRGSLIDNVSAERVDHQSVDQAGMGSERSSPSETVLPSGGLAIAHRRDPNDNDPKEFFPTPPWATRALVEHVFPHLGRPNAAKYATAWEPAAGKGHMAEPLKEYFQRVFVSDKYEYPEYPARLCDFLEEGHDIGADWIITNPPFRPSSEFVLKALDLAHHGVAMFVRLTWLESAGRYEDIFKPHPPTLLAIFAERVPLHKGRWEENGVTMTAYVWLVWIKGAEPRPPFWIPPGCRASLTRPGDVARFGVTEEETDEEAA